MRRLRGDAVMLIIAVAKLFGVLLVLLLFDGVPMELTPVLVCDDDGEPPPSGIANADAE